MAIKTITRNPFHTNKSSDPKKETTHLFDLPTEILVKIQELIVCNSPKDGVMMNGVCRLTYKINHLNMGGGKTINDIIQEIPNLNKEIDELTSSTLPLPTKEKAENFIKLIKNTKKMSDAISILKKEKVRGCAYIYQHLLDKEAFWSCKKKLFQSIPKDSRNPQIIALFIRLAGENRDFKAAKKVYEETNARDRFNGYFTYCNFIYAAGEVGNLDAAIEAFNQAKKLDFDNVSTYRSFIVAAGKNGNMKVAAEAFKESKYKVGRHIFIYLSFIDMAINNDDVKTATRVLEEAKLAFNENFSHKQLLNSISIETTDFSQVRKFWCL